MTLRLAGKVAIITGGASGIGRATALTFLQHGAKVVIGDMNPASLAETEALAAKAGHAAQLASLQGNVAEERDVAALVDLAVSRFGCLDCMFNNAGVGGAFGPIGSTTVEEWDFTFHVLVRGVFLGIKHASNRMRAQANPEGWSGSLINTASIAGIGGGAGPHAYSAAKAAVANLTRAVAAELAAHHIRVNAIAPGMIATPLAVAGKDEPYKRMVEAKQPWPEMGMPQHIADAALWLASEESRFVTGQVIVVDGGVSAQGPDIFGHGASSRMLKKAGLNTGSTGARGTVRDVEKG
jgi:NAD(P)-dependent dehydrogenase (short-subunit alcohol dehydrogenase family)